MAIGCFLQHLCLWTKKPMFPVIWLMRGKVGVFLHKLQVFWVKCVIVEPNRTSLLLHGDTNWVVLQFYSVQTNQCSGSLQHAVFIGLHSISYFPT